MNRLSSTLIVNTSSDARRLHLVLEAISRQIWFPNQVIIAEDGEHIETLQLVKIWAVKNHLSILHVRQRHEGFRKCRILNKAILQATGELIIFLDGDCVPHPRFIGDHLALARVSCFTQGRRSFIEESGIDAFAEGQSLLKLWVDGRLKRPLKSLRFPFPWIRKNAKPDGTLGCNLAVWKADLETINGFDENYEGWGREDTDLAVRLIHLGRKRLIVWGQAILFHLNHPIQPRTHLASNDQRLAQVVAERAIRAKQGLEERRAARESTDV